MKKTSYILLAAAVALLTTSCVKDKVYGIPVIADVQNTVALTAESTVTVTANITSLAGEITAATLTYTALEESKTIDMRPSNGSSWAAVIPAFEMGVKVTYFIEAEAESGEKGRSGDFNYTVGENPIDYSSLVLNELNGNDKFIEIYNGSGNEINITGIQIFKDDKSVWTCDERSLASGAYLLLYSEDVTAAGGAQEGYDEALVFHSGLSAKKAVRVYMTKPDGVTILDDFNFARHDGTKYAGSYGRNADGDWYNQTTSTPGAANVDGEVKLDIGA